MRITKKLYVSLLFSFIAVSVNAKFHDWSYETKYGIELNDNNTNATNIIYRYGKITDVRKWYYYKGHIVGIREEQENSGILEYFIFNQITKCLYKTIHINQWSTELKKRRLRPIITRWFKDHSGLGLLVLIQYALKYWYVSTTLAIIIVTLLYVLFYRALKSHFDLRDRNSIIALITLAVTLLFYYCSTNYNSLGFNLLLY